MKNKHKLILKSIQTHKEAPIVVQIRTLKALGVKLQDIEMYLETGDVERLLESI